MGELTGVMKVIGEEVTRRMNSNDPSHDFKHVLRVRKMALEIAREEIEDGHEIDLEVVEAGALLHDVADWKYSTEEPEKVIESILSNPEVGWFPGKIQKVVAVVKGVGFKDELPSESGVSKAPLTREGAIVQDADRLDAIGAVGIARTFSYGARRGTSFFDPHLPPREIRTREEYMRASSSSYTTYNHFYEKLLKLKDMMKTKGGRRRAESRHDFMLSFLSHFREEVM